ncbi:MAG: CPBP family intramembrane metalloprotease [Verrucomicrobiae bacterium]|nr:CPBP family intramembrane metalloprotease [Verrucomicrobiae bacterium]
MESQQKKLDWHLNQVVPLSLDRLALGGFLIVLCLILLGGGVNFFSVAMVAASLVGCWLAGRQPIAALGLAKSSLFLCVLVPLAAYFVALPLVGLGAVVSEWACRFLGIPWEPQLLLKDFIELKNRDEIVRFFLLAVILAPLSEEILFRGFLYAWFKSFWPRWLALFITAILFSAMHQHLPVFLPLMFLGIFLGLLYELTGSLWTNIGLHALFNAVTLTVAMNYPDLVAVIGR